MLKLYSGLSFLDASLADCLPLLGRRAGVAKERTWLLPAEDGRAAWTETSGRERAHASPDEEAAARSALRERAVMNGCDGCGVQ